MSEKNTKWNLNRKPDIKGHYSVSVSDSSGKDPECIAVFFEEYQAEIVVNRCNRIDDLMAIVEHVATDGARISPELIEAANKAIAKEYEGLT